MSCILHIETSTSACSVAVSEDGQNVFKKRRPERAFTRRIAGRIRRRSLSFADSHAMPLDAVAVSCGPGSYTGLRIGVSMAKGVCYGRNLPLIGLPTLKVQCVPVLLYHDELPEDALLCPMIDARRMEVYAAVYDRALKPVRDIAQALWTKIPIRSFWTGSPCISSATVPGQVQGKDCASQRPFHRRHPSAGKHDVPAGRKKL